MNAKSLVFMAGLSLFLGAGGALAQDEGEEDVTEATIRLMDHVEAKVSANVTKPIELPEHLAADSAGVESSEDGRVNAMDKRDTNRLKGLTTADEASAGGFEMRDAAMGNREEFGRGLENRPDDPPEPPGTPEPQGPPGGG